MKLDVKRGFKTASYPKLNLNYIDTDGVFKGYASVFGAIDLGQDIVQRGAFEKSLKRRNFENIRMLFQHDPGLPIGRWLEIYEDDHGLYVKGQLTLGVQKANDVFALMSAGALDGLSIGFKTIRSMRDKATKARHILEADLLEVSIVTFPMLPQARIQSSKKSNNNHRDNQDLSYPVSVERHLANLIKTAADRF